MASFRKIEITDTQLSKTARVSTARNLTVATTTRIVGTDFGGTGNAGAVDSNFWTAATSGTGASIVQAGGITISSGTSTNGYSTITSVRKARYVAGIPNSFRAVIAISDGTGQGTANNIRRWGIFTDATRVPTNGAYFILNGASLGVATANNGVETIVALASWNGTAYTPDVNYHTYEIIWVNAKVYFFIDDIVRHTLSVTTTPWSQMGPMNINLQNINSTNNTSVDLKCTVASVHRLGEKFSDTQYKNITTATTTNLKYSAGNLHRIICNRHVNGATMTIYDNVTNSAPLIATITPPNGTTPFVLDYQGVPFSNGLTIVTVNTADWTVIYE
ncbi:MAG: hypothetical protein RLY43_1077 [Bacteroidota bacterium]|jgi:hypothetical protein